MDKPKSPKPQMRIDNASKQMVVQRDDAIQKARNSLSLREAKFVRYAISLIRPDDTEFTEYTVDLKVLYDASKTSDESYSRLKKALKTLSDKSFWYKLENGSETLVRWFNTIDMDAGSSKVRFTFHTRMMPFLLHLIEQYQQNGSYYTQYPLGCILPMHSQYGIRLYEILKSYAKNNLSWGFEVDDLKYRLNCEMYVQWNDFKRFVLIPAINDVNQCSDLRVTYETEKDGRRIDRINFKFSKVVDAPAYPDPDLVDPELVKATFVDPDGVEYENTLI